MKNSIELSKFWMFCRMSELICTKLFDIHSILPLEYIRNFIIKPILSVLYHIIVKFLQSLGKKNELIFEFTPPIESIESGFPERVFVHRRLTSSWDLFWFGFWNTWGNEILQWSRFRGIYFEVCCSISEDDYRCMINGENLKLVLRSAPTQHYNWQYRQVYIWCRIDRNNQSYWRARCPLPELTKVDDKLVAPLQELTEVDDEPDASLKINRGYGYVYRAFSCI